MNYLDFELEIGVGSGCEYPVTVLRSAEGEAREIMHLPFNALSLENQLLLLQDILLHSDNNTGQILSSTEAKQVIQKFGQALFDALFIGKVRQRYTASKRAAFHQNKGVRLKLHIQAPEVAALPWEYLYDANQKEYVCLSSNVSIVRYLELSLSPQPVTVTLPLRILGVVANPTNLTDLNITQEKLWFEEAIKDLQAKGFVELTWMQGQTWRDLQRMMRRGPWHIFHFIGHGGFDPKTDEGFIALADDEGQARYLGAVQLGRLLADHRSLGLVVLKSCEGARGSEHNIFSSTAGILVQRGIPSVLTIQYQITDRAMIELFRTFYEAITDGMSVDVALGEARKAISLDAVNTVEWGAAVLYMRSPDGTLFDLLRESTIESTLQDKIHTSNFDVFLSYNIEDRAEVEKIAELLKAQGVLPWLDEWELRPGIPWQRALEEQIGHIGSVAVFIGKSGIGPWQQMELDSFLREFVRRGIPVIPVLLLDAPNNLQLPVFLRDISWVDFRTSTPEPLERLIWGITGRRSQPVHVGVISENSKSGRNAPSISSKEADIRADVAEIILAINDTLYQEYGVLANVIIRRMRATNAIAIESSYFESETIWEISLPFIGLRFNSEKAIFFLRKKDLHRTLYEQLIAIKDDRGADLLFVVDFLDIGKAPPPIDPGIIWLNTQTLEEMVNISADETVAWIGRLVASQIKNFEELIRYHTEGSVEPEEFFGRDYELQLLSSGTARGGVIVGAHRSGKTSLLRQLSERLKKRGYNVGGPYTVHSTKFQTFFLETLDALNIDIPTHISLEAWSSTLRACKRKGERLVLLLDEVDILLEQDAKTEFSLGREMRALQNDGYCKFYLAGHKRLREAIAVENGPFRNFAEEIPLRGLDEDAGLRLIQEPIKAMGFNLGKEQAKRIFEGTAGVAVLIQGFCKRLLLRIRHSRDSEIAEAAIKQTEEDSDYLNMVFEYYEYAQIGYSMAVMLITAGFIEATRQDILQQFEAHGYSLIWDQLDHILKFLIKFGIFIEFEPGRYRVLSKYLCKAIEGRCRNNDETFLISQLAIGMKGIRE